MAGTLRVHSKVRNRTARAREGILLAEVRASRLRSRRPRSPSPPRGGGHASITVVAAATSTRRGGGARTSCSTSSSSYLHHHAYHARRHHHPHHRRPADRYNSVGVPVLRLRALCAGESARGATQPTPCVSCVLRVRHVRRVLRSLRVLRPASRVSYVSCVLHVHRVVRSFASIVSCVSKTGYAHRGTLDRKASYRRANGALYLCSRAMSATCASRGCEENGE